MSLADLVKLKRAAILERWRRMIWETYPVDGASFIEKQKDRFHNPVGHTIGEATAALFDSVAAGRPSEQVAEALDGIIRIRAVQEFSAAQAVAFVFQLKRAIREELGEGISTQELWTGLSLIDASIDQMALKAFDVYMGCRQRVSDVRANELKRSASRLMELVARASGPTEDEVQTVGRNDHKEGA